VSILPEPAPIEALIEAAERCEPARIEARIEATERWIASLRRRIVVGEEMLGTLRDELAAAQIANERAQAGHFEG
jgi:hypothetical protein